VSVWFATLLFLLWLFQRGLKPWLGTTVFFTVVFIVTVANLSFAAFGVFTKTVVGTTAVTAGLFTAGFFTFDVAFFTAGLFTSDVAFFTSDVAFFTAGFFTAGFFTATVLRAVGRRVSGFAADTAVLVQERWADDFSIGSGLVLDKVAGIFRFEFPGITANLTERLGGGGSIGGISGRRRHFDCLYLVRGTIGI
jgi:hypothetical protein